MHDRSRLLKLLETATHSSATENERINALNAFRRISDRCGGIECIFRDNESHEALEELKSVMAQTVLQNARLRAERDALVDKLNHRQSQENSSSKTRPPRPNANNDELDQNEQVRSVVSKEWQELHRIHEAAKMAGFAGGSADTKRHLDRLCGAGNVVRREAGTYPDKRGVTRWHAPSWKLKQGWAQAFRR